MRPLDRPLMLYDGDCGFCRYWIARWRRISDGRIDYVPYQKSHCDFPEIPVDRFRQAVHLVEPDGTITRGAEAVYRALARVPGRGGWLRMYRLVPGFAALSEQAYRFIARRRAGFMTLTLLLERLRPGGGASSDRRG